MKISVKGMMCEHCEMHVKKALEAIDGITSAVASHKDALVTIETSKAVDEKAIKAAGGIKLFLGGTGVDGHIAFNEPGSSLSSKTRVKTLTEDTRIVNSRFFDNDMTQVPETALTVGIGTITDSEEVVIMMNGHNKAQALKHAIEEPISHMWPVSILQMHKKAIIVCDEDCTDELRVGTVKYFKGIESKNKDAYENY